MFSPLLTVILDQFGQPESTTRADLVDACLSPAAKGAAWFLIALCLFEALIYYGLAHTVRKAGRGFHIFAFVLSLIPVIGYTALLSGYGITQFGAPHGDRCFFTARWMMLLLEVPLLVTVCGLVAGVVAFDLSVAAIASFLVMMAGMVGGLIDGNNRWILFLTAFLFAVPVLRSLWNRFYSGTGEVGAFEHEYSSVVANRLGFLTTTVLVYLLTMVVFWALCQGGAVMHASTELLILAICDAIFISSFNIALLSDRETIEKMSEHHARSMVS